MKREMLGRLELIRATVLQRFLIKTLWMFLLERERKSKKKLFDERVA